MRKSPAAFFRTTVHTGGFCSQKTCMYTGKTFERDAEGDATQLGGYGEGDWCNWPSNRGANGYVRCFCHMRP